MHEYDIECKIKPVYQVPLPLVLVQLERVSSLPFHLALRPVKQQF